MFKPSYPPPHSPLNSQKLNKKLLDDDIIKKACEDFIDTDASRGQKNDIVVALGYIHKNLLLPSLSVGDVIEKNNIKTHGFHERFADDVTPDGDARRTPREYITWARMQVALRILEHGPCNMTQLAYALGFNSYPTFWRACLKHLGCKPSEVAKMNGKVG